MSDTTKVEPFLGHGPSGTLTESEARALLAEQKRSGQTLKDFANARGMLPQRLSWWKGRFARDKATAARRPQGRPPKSNATAASSRFLPVAVVTPDSCAAPEVTAGPADGGYELALGAEGTLRIPRDFHEGSLARLLRVLRETR